MTLNDRPAVTATDGVLPPRSTDRREGERGFTLVELAIVLVIIGVIIAGVLQGQSMINTARLNSTVNDIGMYSAAYQTYQQRYNALPGDDESAEDRFGATVDDGNGDGIVDGDYDGEDEETEQFWAHLEAAGLVNSDSQPNNRFGGIFGVMNNAMGLNGLAICVDNLTTRNAQVLVSQLGRGAATPATSTTARAAQVDDLDDEAPAAAWVQDATDYVVCVQM